MSKNSASQRVSVTTSLATTPEVIFSDQVVGRIRIPSGSSITTLTFYDCEEPAGEFALAIDAATNGVLTVAAGRSYKIPYELVGAGCLKIVGNAAGEIYLNMKS